VIVNCDKTKELVFSQALCTLYCTFFVTGIEQVVAAKLLGVTFCHNVKFDEHVKNIFTSYFLKCLKDLPAKELNTLFCALIVSHIL